jgi:hypothetical protein
LRREEVANSNEQHQNNGETDFHWMKIQHDGGSEFGVTGKRLPA